MVYKQIKQIIKPLIPKQLFKHTVNYYHALETVIANLRYGYPSKSMRIIGITGTNGKTSTSIMIATILKEAGYKTGLTSTAVVDYGDGMEENHLDGGLTSAGPFTLQKTLKKMKNNDVKWVVIESSSQALDQHRLDGIKFSAAVITNLTNDHLDYHGTMERYAAAKAILFKKTRDGLFVTNADDKWSDYFHNIPAKHKVQYGKKATDYKIFDISHEGKRTVLTFEHTKTKYTVNLQVQGDFNVYNALAAIATTHEQGVDLSTAIHAIEGLERIPGRMDAVETGQDFKVLIDYAHTPDAIKNVLRATRQFTDGKLICVTGASGERSSARRAPVGKIADELSDILVVTDDEPHAEDPDKIRNELLSGITASKNNAQLTVEPDRCKAMAKAFAVANKNDVVIIVGMGHQSYRYGPNGQEPWSDKEVAAALLLNKKPPYCDNWHRVMRDRTKK